MKLGLHSCPGRHCKPACSPALRAWPARAALTARPGLRLRRVSTAELRDGRRVWLDYEDFSRWHGLLK